jgi:hypothetical protein
MAEAVQSMAPWVSTAEVLQSTAPAPVVQVPVSVLVLLLALVCIAL